MPTGFLWREAIAAVGGRTAWEPTFVCLPTQMGSSNWLNLANLCFLLSACVSPAPGRR